MLLCVHRSSLEALQQDLERADAELKEVEGRLHELEGKNDQVAKQVRFRHPIYLPTGVVCCAGLHLQAGCVTMLRSSVSQSNRLNCTLIHRVSVLIYRWSWAGVLFLVVHVSCRSVN